MPPEMYRSGGLDHTAIKSIGRFAKGRGVSGCHRSSGPLEVMFRGKGPHLASCRWLARKVFIFGELLTPFCFPVHFSPSWRNPWRLTLAWIARGKTPPACRNISFFFSKSPWEKGGEHWCPKKQGVFRPGIWPLAKADIRRGQFPFREVGKRGTRGHRL
jgi:hypothetical protein